MPDISCGSLRQHVKNRLVCRGRTWPLFCQHSLTIICNDLEKLAKRLGLGVYRNFSQKKMTEFYSEIYFKNCDPSLKREPQVVSYAEFDSGVGNC